VGKKKPSFSEKLGFLSGYTHHLNRERKESHDAKKRSAYSQFRFALPWYRFHDFDELWRVQSETEM